MINQHLLAQFVPITVNSGDSNYDYITNLKPSAYVATAISLLLGLAGVGFFIYLLWGGVQWITAGGDKDGIDKARRKIINALIGLVIVFSSYAILYILRVLFNVNPIGFTLRNL